MAMIAVIILILYLKCCQGKAEYQLGFYQYWERGQNEFVCCRAAFVEQGYEGIPCKENRKEDTVRKYPPGKVQPDKKNSEHEFECMVESEYTEGYEGIPWKENGTDDTVREYPPGKVKPDKKISEHEFECMVESEYTEDTTLPVAETSGMEHRNKSDNILEYACLSLCGSMFPLGDFRNNYGIKKLKIETTLSFGEYSFQVTSNGLQSLHEGSNFTWLTQTNISDITLPVGITSVIDNRNKRDKNAEDAGLSASQVISPEFTIVALVTGFTSLVLGITVGVYIICCVYRRLHGLNRATENEHQPLQNHSGAICIPMEGSNVNPAPVPSELQESDLDNQNEIVDSNPESLEGQNESESGGRTVDHSNDCNDSPGLFGSINGSRCNRCNRRSNKTRCVAIVKPQQAVNEMPSTGSVGSEMSVDGYSNFSSSIYHDLESRDTTNTVDEETTLLKSVYREEVTDSDEQVSSTVQHTNEVVGACFEESHQADIDNENHMNADD